MFLQEALKGPCDDRQVPQTQSQSAPAAQLAAWVAGCRTCSRASIPWQNVCCPSRYMLRMLCSYAQPIPACPSTGLQQLSLTSQKAEGMKEGFSLEANALTGAEAAMLPCITQRANASQHAVMRGNCIWSCAAFKGAISSQTVMLAHVSSNLV